MIDKMYQATFSIKITDDQYSALNLLPGDMVLCDEETNEGPLLICVWDDAAHICLRTDYGALFDCGSHCLAPSKAVVYGRPLSVIRDICVGKETTV